MTMDVGQAERKESAEEDVNGQSPLGCVLIYAGRREEDGRQDGTRTQA